MTKEKRWLLIPLLVIAGFLIYCWIIILSGDILASWRHYMGLVLFILVAYLFFVNTRLSVLACGIYLVIATFNGLAITPAITTSWINIGSFSTPPVQLLSLGLLALYLVFNLGTLIDMWLDFREKRKV